MRYQINEKKNIYIQYIYKDIHKCVSYARSNLHFLHVQPKQIMHATKHATSLVEWTTHNNANASNHVINLIGF